MVTETPKERELRHELNNKEQEKRALQGLLKSAAEEIEDLNEADCEPAAKEHAAKTAKKLKRAASL